MPQDFIIDVLHATMAVGPDRLFRKRFQIACSTPCNFHARETEDEREDCADLVDADLCYYVSFLTAIMGEVDKIDEEVADRRESAA